MIDSNALWCTCRPQLQTLTMAGCNSVLEDTDPVLNGRQVLLDEWYLLSWAQDWDLQCWSWIGCRKSWPCRLSHARCVTGTAATVASPLPRSPTEISAVPDFRRWTVPPAWRTCKNSEKELYVLTLKSFQLILFSEAAAVGKQQRLRTSNTCFALPRTKE